ncbi:serine/threonine-protein kinase [Okeanomitos corallinicola TIOX110]|uniref:Serine/threonine-protein kinase n=1 Tax=Okeanomitos corallinicola TIOX110 TaxID=3133117 RepID=A0ABZ2UT64_9CYAN
MTKQDLGDFTKEILLERYEVQQQLGKKAGRRTLLTRDLQTQELVVVKLLTFDDEFQWEDLKLFEREAETLKSISHPAIPRYLDYFELDAPNYKGFALVQSYIPAQSLETQIKAGRSFNEQEVKQLATALLEILKYLHSQQPPVIHRDIKPSNILLTNRSGNNVGDVYLVDFGSVQTIVRTNSTMTVVGSYGYMPPEQFSGKATPASDLYGLGATLIYLVTGQHPADLPQQDLVIQFKEFANITPHFSSWLQKMTQPILSQRMASADKALAALQRQQPRQNNQIHLPINNFDFTLEKPFASQIFFNQTTEFLEIIIPPQGGISKLGVMLIWYFISVIPIYITLIFFGPLLGILSTLLLPLHIFMLFFVVLMGKFGRKRLLINRKYISLSHELFGMRRYTTIPSARKNIIRLQRSITYYNMTPQPYLIIWAGLIKYEIHTSKDKMFSISTLELDWLAQELSDWLGLPIVQE